MENYIPRTGKAGRLVGLCGGRSGRCNRIISDARLAEFAATLETNLAEGQGLDIATVDRAADAILRFEESTGFKPFHIDQAKVVNAKLAKAKNARTGQPLSKATIDGTLRANKAFFLWLADKSDTRNGYTIATTNTSRLWARTRVSPRHVMRLS